MKKLALTLALVAAAAFATSPPLGTGGSVRMAIQDLCCELKGLLPVASMLMIVVAGVIYAAGQIMGAETRARANVWATAALVGALIGVLIYAVAPPVLDTIYSQSGTATGQVSCVSAC
ncbi:MAG: hypothetical protein N3F07_00265 [Candidatus Micrarchaeota archaeon]|nr:hypothetical protein [Candidatus Micrarchaeota archaeon]